MAFMSIMLPYDSFSCPTWFQHLTSDPSGQMTVDVGLVAQHDEDIERTYQEKPRFFSIADW
ncbi:MAG: hypothetical protein BWX90_00305 [bacterium ADurb.Bin132]|nr:MAG: hypothetical protein BWX90_00305 [bacterium ADurb.Bin132]